MTGERPVSRSNACPATSKYPCRTARPKPVMASEVGLLVPPRAEFYQPNAQRSFPFMAFVVRTRHDPAATVPFIRSEIAQLDPIQPISNVATMDEHLARALSRPRSHVHAGRGVRNSCAGVVDNRRLME